MRISKFGAAAVALAIGSATLLAAPAFAEDAPSEEISAPQVEEYTLATPPEEIIADVIDEAVAPPLVPVEVALEALKVGPVAPPVVDTGETIHKVWVITTYNDPKINPANAKDIWGSGQDVYTIQCNVWIQDDVLKYGTPTARAIVDALDDDLKLVAGEDSKVYVSHEFRFVKCLPPVIVPTPVSDVPATCDTDGAYAFPVGYIPAQNDGVNGQHGYEGDGYHRYVANTTGTFGGPGNYVVQDYGIGAAGNAAYPVGTRVGGKATAGGLITSTFVVAAKTGYCPLPEDEILSTVTVSGDFDCDDTTVATTTTVTTRVYSHRVSDGAIVSNEVVTVTEGVRDLTAEEISNKDLEEECIPVPPIEEPPVVTEPPAVTPPADIPTLGPATHNLASTGNNEDATKLAFLAVALLLLAGVPTVVVATRQARRN